MEYFFHFLKVLAIFSVIIAVALLAVQFAPAATI